MKKIIISVLLIFIQLASFACPVCERNKPEILRGITHSSGPENMWDYVIVAVTAIIALLTLYFSVKWLINPKENNRDHIKLSILNEQ